MTNQNFFNVPSQLNPFKESILNTVIESNIIAARSEEASLLESKFGGLPYLPYNQQYPQDAFGRPMLLLAQINFSEVMFSEYFPKDGILQFFIAQDYYHLAMEVKEKYASSLYEIRYYSKVHYDQTYCYDSEFLKDANYDGFPFKDTHKLVFNKSYEPVSATDFRIASWMAEDEIRDYMLENGTTFEETYMQLFLGADHKIGGYPYFIHDDIRIRSNYLKKYDTLLFQIISDDDQNIMWGNSGVIKFFIQQKDLARLNFSNVLFITEEY